MFPKISLMAAFGFFLIAAAPFASASECKQSIAVPAAHSAIPRDGSASIVIAEEGRESDSADSDDNSDSNDPSESADNDKDDNDQTDQQNAGNPQVGAQIFSRPDNDGGEAGQAPVNAYGQPLNSSPQQVNPYQ